jgi:hypothetical protein
MVQNGRMKTTNRTVRKSEARKEKKKAFFELAERFRSSEDSTEAKRLGKQLGRFVFDNVVAEKSKTTV